MSNQANYLPTNYPLTDLNPFDEQSNDLMNEWKNEIFYSHDAPYILRKRALLHDLCQLEAPCEATWKEAMLCDDMLTDKTKAFNYQYDFLQEPLKSNETFENTNWEFEDDFSYSIDNNWYLDCNMTVQ